MVHVIDRIRGVASDRMHLALMLILTFSTGIVDAVGYLGLDRVFTGNMTGNLRGLESNASANAGLGAAAVAAQQFGEDA